MLNRKIILLPLLIILGFIAGFVFLLRGCLQKHNNYGVTGVPVVSADGRLLVVVVAENEATTYSQNGGYRRTTYSTSYWLKQYDTETGKLLKKKKLVKASELNNRSVACYGAYEGYIWLHTDQLRAYEVGSLDEKYNEEKIAAAGNINPDIFPYEERLIRPAVENGYIDFFSNSGEEYRLTLSRLEIIPKADLPEEKNTKSASTSHVFHQDDYGVRSDSMHGKMFIFAKDSTEARNSSPGSYSLHEVSYRMKLFTATYTTRVFGSHRIFSYDGVQRTGEATYLNPCFAKDSYQDKVIQLANPDGFLVIQQDVLGNNSRAVFTRIDTANRKVWETKSPVSTKIADCIFTGNYCIVTTNKDYAFSPFIGKDALCIINTGNGKLVLPSLKD